MVKIKDLSFKYGNSTEWALKEIDIEIAAGECVLICGGSGCGKTTVMKVLNGLIPHYFEGELKGSAECCGLDVAKTPIENLSGKVGSVFQNPRSQFFCVDTTGELAFGCENQELDADTIKGRIQKVTKEMSLDNLIDRNIFALSGGEKQKIACASVSAMEPELFVLDEPTSNLDYNGIRMLKEVLKDWKDCGKTIVIAEHRLGWLSEIADRVILLENGVIKAEYAGQDFFRIKTETLNDMGLRAFRAGKEYPDYPEGFYQITDGFYKDQNVYSFRDFIYSYRKGIGILTLDELTVPVHSVVALIGNNGAGKSTFAKCLCGLAKGFKGSVSIDGRIYKGKKLINLCYMVMQDVNHQLFTDSCLEEVMLGMVNENKDAALETLDHMGLKEFAVRHPMSLSGGQKQRLAICQAYLSDRDIIVFDEPTSGQDFGSMKKTAALIKEISKDKTVFIITHDMELVESCCSHVLRL